MGATLLVRVGEETFAFESPPGEPFTLESAVPKGYQEAAHAAFSAAHPLPPRLRARIKAEVRWSEGYWGRCFQLTFGICCPTGLLLGECFELERDVPLLRASVANALIAAGMPPGSFELEDHTAEGSFTEGRVLLRLRTR